VLSPFFLFREKFLEAQMVHSQMLETIIALQKNLQLTEEQDRKLSIKIFSHF